MRSAFKTARLAVHVFDDVKPTPQHIERTLYVGFRHDEDRPLPCVTMLLSPRSDILGGYYVDWIETTSEYRRMGFASELFKAVASRLDAPLVYDGGSDSGDAFCGAMDAEFQP